jgi:hypothetical protein
MRIDPAPSSPALDLRTLVYPATHWVTYRESERVSLHGLSRREWRRPFQETERRR